MSLYVEIAKSMASLQPKISRQKLDERTVRTVPFPPSHVGENEAPDVNGVKDVQRQETKASEPSETHLTLLQASWPYVARQALIGVLVGCGDQLRECLSIGLRRNQNAIRQRTFQPVRPKPVRP